MSKKKNNGSSKRDFYSDDMTKAVIGNLFAEYAAEDGKNYFAPDNSRTRKLSVDEEAEEIEEEIEIEEAVEEDLEVPDFAEEIEEEVYTPRRKRNKQKEQEPAPKKKGLLSVFNNDDEDLEQEEDEIELPKKKSVREAYEEKTKIPKFMQEISEESDFFEEEEEEEVIELPIGRVAIVVGAVLLVVILLWLAISRASYKNQLEDANVEIARLTELTTSSTYEAEIAQLKAQVNELTAENDKLKNSAVTVSGVEADEEKAESDENTENAENENQATENEEDEKINQNTADETSYTIYTVQAGDYPFSISEEVYGDGSRYKEILEFNSITGDDLVAGMELKIPN